MNFLVFHQPRLLNFSPLSNSTPYVPDQRETGQSSNRVSQLSINFPHQLPLQLVPFLKSPSSNLSFPLPSQPLPPSPLEVQVGLQVPDKPSPHPCPAQTPPPLPSTISAVEPRKIQSLLPPSLPLPPTTSLPVAAPPPHPCRLPRVKSPHR